MGTWNRLIVAGGEEEGGNGGKKGKEGTCINDSWIWTTERGLTVGEMVGLGGRRQKGKKRNWDNRNRINNKKFIKSKKYF